MISNQKIRQVITIPTSTCVVVAYENGDVEMCERLDLQRDLQARADRLDERIEIDVVSPGAWNKKRWVFNDHPPEEERLYKVRIWRHCSQRAGAFVKATSKKAAIERAVSLSFSEGEWETVSADQPHSAYVIGGPYRKGEQP